MPSTITAISTPPGTGAVAILRISGPEALSILERIFCPLKGDHPLPARQLVLGDVVDEHKENSEKIDRALAVTMPGPNSFTGEDVVELHLHGSPAVQAATLRLALACGARMAEPGEFSRRAFENGRMDLLEAEGLADLIAAQTEAGMRAARRLFTGALSREIGAQHEALVDALMLLDAAIDFTEEDVPEVQFEAIGRTLDVAHGALARLAETYAEGRILREGAAVVLAGAPNVGKSTLMNALLGVERVLVHDAPGTTRDTIEEGLSIAGIPLRLVDTAGLRPQNADAVERAGMALTQAKVADADLVVTVLDATRPLEEHETAFLQTCPRPQLVVLNKCDAVTDTDRHYAWDALEISAKERMGLEALRERIAAALGRFEDDHPVILRERQRDMLRRAVEELERARAHLAEGAPPDMLAFDIRQALDALAGLLGRVTSEDILDRIFSTFCVGK